MFTEFNVMLVDFQFILAYIRRLPLVLYYW